MSSAPCHLARRPAADNHGETPMSTPSSRSLSAAAAATLAAPRARAAADRWLLAIIGAAVVARAIFLALFYDLALYTDELQYQEIAVNLVEGRGFALGDRLTSWRPPLYPFLVSLLYRLAGTTDPAVVRAFQALLSLGTVALVYGLARRTFGLRVARGAALVIAFYPTLLFHANHLITETLFVFLTTLTAWALVAYLDRPRAAVAAGAGLALGLATLTRDIVWPTVAIMAALVVWRARPVWGRGARHAALLVAGLLVLTVPWVVRNTRVQGTFTLLSTNGGMVFLAGNYEHTPLDRPWRAHGLDPSLKVRRLFPEHLSEGEVQKLAVRRALAYIAEHPRLTLRNSIVRIANVWGLEREIVAAFANKVYGKPDRLTMLGVSAAIFGSYALLALAGFTGLFFALARGGQALPWHLYVAGMVAFITLAHAPVSGHPRYHLQLVPLLALYAVEAWRTRRELWEARRSWPGVAAATAAALLALAWGREVLFVDLHRFLNAISAL